MNNQTDLFSNVGESTVNNSSRRRKRGANKNELQLTYESDSSDDQEGNSDNENNISKLQQQLEEDILGDNKENDMFDSDKEDDMFTNDNKQEDDDDDDMFASDNEESDPQKNNLDDEEEEEEEEEIKETDESVNNYYNNIEDLNFDSFQNKKKEPKFEAFNLKEETNMGKFDNEGNYIPNEQKDSSDADDDDLWLEDYNNKSEINKAKQAQLLRERQQREKSKSKSMEKDHNVEPLEVLLSDLILLLEPVESPMEALARLNPKKLRKKKKKGDDDDNNKNSIANHEELINRITNVCSILINDKQIDDIYELTREELMRKFQTITGQSFNVERGLKRSREESDDEDDENSQINNIDYGEKIWEFRWIGDENEDKVINGPYSSYEMNHWKETYFENKVEVRKIGETKFQNIEYINGFT